MEKDELIAIFIKYRNNQCSPREADRLIRYIQSGRDRELVEGLIGNVSDEEFSNEPITNNTFQELLDEVFVRIQQHKDVKRKTIPLYRRLAVRWAAAALFMVSFTAILYVVQKEDKTPHVVNLKEEDIAPGGNRAQLTLGDGEVISLSENQSGIIVGENTITYEDGIGQVAMLSRFERQDTSMMLSITTPKGGTYQVTLSDGSKIWLNAASTLSYPSRFIDQERRVMLTGEAYFDVKPDSRKTFSVESQGQVVEVLGTQFNVMAYPDEAAIKTTLVHGAVRLKTGKVATALSPGEQGTFHNGGIEVEQVDVASYVGWKDGEFVLSDYH